jgi:type II secretory ATPase GspE/PulE/Tfp pilus assembly ATPase PilB-like protein
MGIFEAIKMDNIIADNLSESKNINERKIKSLALSQKIPTMREDGIIKVLKGETSIDELKSVVDLLNE